MQSPRWPKTRKKFLELGRRLGGQELGIVARVQGSRCKPRAETHFASHGSAAPTFRRAKFNLIAWHNRPKVGATRAAASGTGRQRVG